MFCIQCGREHECSLKSQKRCHCVSISGTYPTVTSYLVIWQVLFATSPRKPPPISMATVSSSMQLLILGLCAVGTTQGEGEEVSEQGQEKDEERKSDASRRRQKEPTAASSIPARNNCNPGDGLVLCQRIFKNKFDRSNFPLNPQNQTKF